MTVRQLGGVLGALGGLVWIVRWVLNPDSSGTADILRYVGLGFIALGLVCVGLTLVKGLELWLDIIVGFAAPALFWAIYEVVRGGMENDFVFHGVLGIVWVLLGALLFVKGKSHAAAPIEAHV